MNEIDYKIKEIWARMKREKPLAVSADCPDDKKLLHYVSGVLPGREQEMVEKHLLSCDSCLDLIISYEKARKESLAAVHETPAALIEKTINMLPEKNVTEDIFDIVIRFAKEAVEIIRNPGNLIISQGPVPVPLRGGSGVASADSVTLIKKFSHINAELEVVREKSNNLNIKVLVTDAGTAEPVSGLRISVFDPSQEIASFVAENGEADFTEMGSGRYVVKFMRKGKKIGQVSLDFKQ